MHSRRQGRIETLGKSLAESNLMREFFKFFLGELLVESMQPIAEIGPLPVLLEIFEQCVDVPLESLVFPGVLFFLFLH